MRKSNLEKLREQKQRTHKVEEVNSLEGLVGLLVDGNRHPTARHVNPTQLKFIADTVHRMKAYKGPAGCAKTSTIVAEALIHAITEPGSKVFIARRDYNDLKGTTMLRAIEMLDMLPPGTLLDRNKEAPEKWVLKPIELRMPDGTIIDTPSTITFIGMSDELKGSYEFNGGVIDEADECSEKSVMGFLGRCRWMGGGTGLAPHRWISLAFNPPDVTHWLYTACTGLNAQGERVGTPTIQLYEPHPKENTRNLPPNYYEDMTEKLPEDMRQRLVDGVWGSTFPGQPVVRQFKRALHTRLNLKYEGGTLYRFWDFGYRRPCVLWAQVHRDGNLQVLRELLGHNITGTAFIAMVKAQTAEHFPQARRWVDYGDPAVEQKKDTGQMSSLLREAGIDLLSQRVSVDVSMLVLRKRFETIIGDDAAVLIDARFCPILCGGLAGGYHFKKDGVTPNKDGYYDHLIDAFRYGVYNIFGVFGNSTATSNLPTSVAYWTPGAPQ